MNWLPTIHLVTVVVATFGALLGAALMQSALEIRERRPRCETTMERRILDQAYFSARLIMRPDKEWLDP